MRYIRGSVLDKIPNPNLRFFVDEASGCHVWQGALNSHGYGIVGTNRTGTFRAHRVAYEMAKGPIPAGMQLDHKCRNRACINPEHLEPVTNAENARRGAKAKLNREKVSEMRRLRNEEKMTYRQLAVRFGISSCAVSNIFNGKRWAEDAT